MAITLLSLIPATPILLCEYAQAQASTLPEQQQTSLAGSSFGLQQQPLPQRSQSRLGQILPLSTTGQLQTKLPSFNLLSEVDLYSTLNSLKIPQDPQLQERFLDIKNRASTLSTQYQSLRVSYAQYLNRIDAYNLAQTNLQETADILESKSVALETASSNYQLASQEFTVAQQEYTEAQETLQRAQDSKAQAEENLEAQREVLDNAQSILQESQEDYQQAVAVYQLKQSNLATAQSNYNNNLIPDPTWIAPTYQKENIRIVENTRTVEVRTQVPTTTMIATGGILAEVFNRNGYNNAPPLPTSNETPIYTTTVSTIDFNWGSGQVLNSGRSEDVIIRFTANFLVPEDGYYQFYAPADDGTKLNIAGMQVIDDWYDKGGGGTISDPVYIRAGIFYPFTFYYYENGGGAAVSLYTYSPQQGMTLVPTTWMGSSAEQQTTYKEVITYEEETYYTYETYYTTELVPGATAPLIKNPALLPLVQQAQQELSEAEIVMSQKEAALNLSTENKTNEQEEFTTLSRIADSTDTELSLAEAEALTLQTELDQKSTNKTSALEAQQLANTEYSEATTSYATADVASKQSITELNKSETSTKSQQDTYRTNASVISADVSALTQDVDNYKEPEPQKPEEGSKEIPQDLSASNLMSVDLEAVDPTELTEAQAEQLVEAALETFETAEEGSPEYEQALDALYLAAEQDDIVLDPALAAIPGLQAATELVNFLGNAGADMSPKVREESEKIVVTAVVAAGAAIQSAAAAASMSSASTRKIGN